MLTNLFESRGKEFSSLLKIGDYLARSLREQVELFYLDGNRVTYVTESGKVVAGNYNLKPLKLTNIQVEDASVLETAQSFEKVVNKKVSVLLRNLLENDYEDADNTFDGLMDLYTTRLSYDRIKERLSDKVERFGEQTKIVSSPEFQKVFELKDKLVEFLKENKEIAKIPEIKNGMKLAQVVSKAFNIPKITFEQLSESKTFLVKSEDKSSIYEHLCKQELIAKELLEAKESFDTVWADNELIDELASMVFEKKRNKIEEKVAQVVSQIPYFALATKKQLTNIFENRLNISDLDVSNKDINSFVSTIFEMKKPVKTYIVKILNEKYGININELGEVPTFSNLLKTEMVILASLAKLAPKNSLLKEHLNTLAQSLKVKNGTEAIDLVDFLNEVFNKAGYKASINETSLMQYLDFTQVAEDLGKIGAILKLLRPVLGGAGGMAGMGGMGGGMPGMGGGSPTPPMPQPLANNMEGQDQDGLPGMEGDQAEGQMGDAEDAAMQAQGEGPEGLGMEGQDHLEPDGDEGMGMEGDEMGMEGEQGMGGPDPLSTALQMGMGQEDAEAPSDVNADDISNIVAAIEDLLGNIKAQTGDPGMEDGGEGIPGEVDPNMEDPGMEGMEPGLEGMEGEMGEEGLEGEPEIDDIEGDADSSDFEGEEEESDEGEEESEEPKDKKKFPPKK